MTLFLWFKLIPYFLLHFAGSLPLSLNRRFPRSTPRTRSQARVSQERRMGSTLSSRSDRNRWNVSRPSLVSALLFPNQFELAHFLLIHSFVCSLLGSINISVTGGNGSSVGTNLLSPISLYASLSRFRNTQSSIPT